MKIGTGAGTLSAEADELLAFVASKGGEAVNSFEDAVVNETVRAGLVEHVTIGVHDPILVLTPAGRKRVGLI